MDLHAVHEQIVQLLEGGAAVLFGIIVIGLLMAVKR